MADSGTPPPTTASGTKRPAPTPSPAPPPLGDTPSSSSSPFATAAKRPSIGGNAEGGGGGGGAAAGASNVARASPTSSMGSASAADKSSSSSSSSRGLRHFSMMVCQKVEEKGTTTYNEVADELVKKVIAERRKEDPNGKFDEKNIRRRVYDALNVLMAMDIIAKEKKEITWKGLPTAAKQDMDVLQQEIDYRRYQLGHKKEALKELLTQQVCFRNLVVRNHQGGAPDDDKIPLPFIVVNTHSSAVIQCDMSRDRTDVMFDFSMPFEINDDNTILKKMGMNRTSMSTLRQMLPEDLLRYCQTNHLVDAVIGREMSSSTRCGGNGGGGGGDVEPLPVPSAAVAGAALTSARPSHY